QRRLEQCAEVRVVEGHEGEFVGEPHAELAARGEAAERELGARRDDRGRRPFEGEERACLLAARVQRPRPGADQLRRRAGGGNERVQALASRRLLPWSGEKGDASMAVAAEVLDE